MVVFGITLFATGLTNGTGVVSVCPPGKEDGATAVISIAGPPAATPLLSTFSVYKSPCHPQGN